MADLSILDQSAAHIREASIDPADIPTLIAAEEAGKTRKSVLAYLNSLPAPSGPENGPGVDEVEVENILPGTDLTINAGRRLLFGETAVVPFALAAFLRERGQVK